MLKSWLRFTYFLPLLVGFLLPTNGTLQNEKDPTMASNNPISDMEIIFDRTRDPE
jgi:hypothetical protein